MTQARIPHVLVAMALSVVLGACGPAGNSNVPPGHGDAGGDSGGDTDSGPQPHTLTTIVVSPTNTILEVDLNTPTTQAFTAQGRYADGAVEDLTAQVNWSSTNAALGDMNGATLEVPGIASAGAWITMIEARSGTIKGVGQVTVVAYRKTGDQTDFFFKLPYQDPAGDQDKPLDFHTNVQSLDVFFAVDVTGSMGGEIANLQTSLNTIVTAIRNEIPSTNFGVGAMADFPIDPYGNATAGACGQSAAGGIDQPFKLVLAISDNVTSVQTALGTLAIGGMPIWCGNDWPEGQIEALYQIATGDGLTTPSPTNIPVDHNRVGGVEYRHGSLPVVVPITDAYFHDPGSSASCNCDGGACTWAANYSAAINAVAHTRQQAKDKLNAICAKVVGVASIESGVGGCSGLADEEDFAKTTGARVPPVAWQSALPAGCTAGQCCTGISGVGRAPDGDGLCPLVFQINADGTGLGTSIVTGLKMLTRYAKFDVKTETVGNPQGDNNEPLPTGYTTASFIKSITPASSTAPTPPPTLPQPTIVGMEFHDVYPGSVVTFTVDAYNDFLEQTDQPQIFRATIKVLAGGCTDLDQREVLILVPPKDIILG
jgi:hypothetical protein